MIIEIDDSKIPSDFAEWLSKLDNATIINILKTRYMAVQQQLPIQPTPVNETKIVSSRQLGIDGEQEIIDLLSPLYELQFNVAHKGDIIVKKDGRSLMIEVKNYSNTVPYTEVDKFYGDLDCNTSYIGGIFISLKSKISKINKSLYFTKHNNQYVMFLSISDKNTILSMISLLFEIGCYTSVDCGKLIHAINDLDDIKSCMSTCMNVFSESKTIFDKNYNTFARKMESLNEKFSSLIGNLASYIETNEIVGDLDDITKLIVDKFPDSLAAKTQSHLRYISKFSSKVKNIKNKSTIECDDFRADLLKTKTNIYISCDLIKNIEIGVFLLYDVAVDGGMLKIEINNKNIPLLEKLI